MDWNAVWKIIVAALASVGGAGVIIAFFAKLLANQISERMLKKYDAELQKDIENYKHDLEVETEIYKANNERISYVTQRQFDTEFEAYQIIFNDLYAFSEYTRQLFPTFDYLPKNDEDKKKLFEERYNRFCDAYDSFSNTLEKNAPFISRDIYYSLVDIKAKAYRIGVTYPDIKIIDDPKFDTENKEIAKDCYKDTREFNKMVADVKDEVREYLSTLKVDKE